MKHRVHTKVVFDMTKADAPIIQDEWEWSDRPVAECKSKQRPGGTDAQRESEMSGQEKKLYRRALASLDEGVAVDRANRPRIYDILDEERPELSDEVTLAAKERALQAYRGDIGVSPALEKEIADNEAMIREEMARSGKSVGSTPWAQTMDSMLRRQGDVREDARRGMIAQATGDYQSGLGLYQSGVGLSDQNRFNSISALMNMPKNLIQGSQAYLPMMQPFQNESRNQIGSIFQSLNMAHASNTGKAKSTEALVGGIGEGAAGACCFIFIAGHGFLHPVVRAYRDMKMNTRNRRGYYWLADRLVPLMERSRLFKRFIKLVMIRPMTSYGKYYFKINKYGALFSPIASFWLRLFTLLGFRKPYQRRGTSEVV